MINSIHLRYFYFSVKLRSFRKAATFCNVTQPAISQAIKKLEADLNVILLVRNKSSFYLTAYGQELYKFSEKYWDEFTKLKDSFQKIDQGEKILKIGINKHYDGYCLPLIRGFMAQYPDVCCEYEFDNGEEIRKRFEDGCYDVIFAINFDKKDKASWSLPLGSVYLFEDKIQLCCDQKHPLASQKSVSLKEASQYPFLLPSFYKQPILDRFAANNLQLKIKGLFNQSKIVAQLLPGSDALGILAKKSIPKESLQELSFLDCSVFEACFVLSARFFENNDCGYLKGRENFKKFLSKNKADLFKNA